MARKTSAKNTKEPVRLREKELANGVRSLYLDIYVNGKRSYEFLKLYLIPETNPQAKVQNENTMRAANTIKLNRILEITNNKAGLKNTSIRAKMLLKDWMETFRQAQEQKGVKDQKLIHNTVHALTAYNINVAMRDVNRDYIIGLTNFLRNDYRSPRQEVEGLFCHQLSWLPTQCPQYGRARGCHCRQPHHEAVCAG